MGGATLERRPTGGKSSSFSEPLQFAQHPGLLEVTTLDHLSLFVRRLLLIQLFPVISLNYCSLIICSYIVCQEWAVQKADSSVIRRSPWKSELNPELSRNPVLHTLKMLPLQDALLTHEHFYSNIFNAGKCALNL